MLINNSLYNLKKMRKDKINNKNRNNKLKRDKHHKKNKMSKLGHQVRATKIEKLQLKVHKWILQLKVQIL